jgi:hypothetical protein
MKETEKAYIAGLIDGEGTISISHNNSQGSDAYSIVLRIYNSDKRMIDWVENVTGYGNVREEKMRKDNWNRPNIKPMYKWAIYANNIRKLLPEIEKYLVIKKEQSQIMQEFLDLTNHFKGKHLTDEHRNNKRELCIRMMRLNQRGNKEQKYFRDLKEHVSL